MQQYFCICENFEKPIELNSARKTCLRRSTNVCRRSYAQSIYFVSPYDSKDDNKNIERQPKLMH
jgi:hypothetical protein